MIGFTSPSPYSDDVFLVGLLTIHGDRWMTVRWGIVCANNHLNQLNPHLDLSNCPSCWHLLSVDGLIPFLSNFVEGQMFVGVLFYEFYLMW